MRWDNLNLSLSKGVSGQQGLWLLKCQLDLHSCKRWPLMNPGRKASSWIMNKYSVSKHINHHQSWTSTVTLTFAQNFIQTINLSPWLTAKADVWFMLLNTRLLTEWKMLKDFKIKLMESQSFSQKSDKWFLTTRENRLIHQLILFFKACVVLPRKCKEKAVNTNVGNKCFKWLQQGCTNYTNSQKLQAVISKVAGVTIFNELNEFWWKTCLLACLL